MKRAFCRLIGHRDIPVIEAGIVPRPGGMLPMLDGYMTYRPDDTGEFRACTRCGRVERAS